MNSDIKGIIFDYGGTLDSRGEHWSEVIYRGWKAAGIKADKETFRECYVHAERQLARQRIILPCDDFRALMAKKAAIELEYAAAERGIAVPAGAADAVADYCDASARACIDEARPVLELLVAQGYPLALVSNFYGNVAEVLRAYGIRQFFSHIIESAIVGVRKPDARIFMLGVVALGLDPCQVLVVGDSLTKDILPAESIGCHTAWLKGKGWTAAEDAATHPSQIATLQEIF